MGSLFAKLGVFLGASLTALFGAWKTIVVVTMLSAAVIYAYNMMVELTQELLEWVTIQAGSVTYPGEGVVFEFTGLMGYMMQALKIPECMAFIISMVTIKFLLRKIPIIKW